jgi:hypothetical protein
MERDPPIRFTPHGAYLPLFPERLGTSVFQTLEDVLSATNQLNGWLAAWANSCDRLAATSPEWARQRNISSERVRTLAQGLAGKVAKSKSSRIRIESVSGRSETLCLPARQQLIPPAPAKSYASHLTRVKSMAEYTTCITPTGTTLHIPVEALPDLASASGTIELVYSRTRTVPARLARGIRKVSEDDPDER